MNLDKAGHRRNARSEADIRSSELTIASFRTCRSAAPQPIAGILGNLRALICG
jgi:hypothetical protein